MLPMLFNNDFSKPSFRESILPLGLIFFNTWFTDFFSQNIKVGGGKKIKIKITKIFFLLFNLKHIWIGEKTTTKNCMILHCKNAEMTIILSFLHFYSVKSYNFFFFPYFFFFF